MNASNIIQRGDERYDWVRHLEAKGDHDLIERLLWVTHADLKDSQGAFWIDRNFLNILDEPNATFNDLEKALIEYARTLDYKVIFTVEQEFNSYFQGDAVKVSWRPE